MLKFALISLFTLISTYLFCIEVPGYYITLENDTIQTTFRVPDKLERGQYAIGGGYLKIQKEIISVQDGIEKKLTPKEIKEFSFNLDGIEIRMLVKHSMDYNLGDIFKRVIFEGQHVMVVGEYLRFRGSLNGGGNVTGVKYWVTIKHSDNTSTSDSESAESNWGKKALADIFKECPKVVGKIQAKILKRDDIGMIAEEYEECLKSASQTNKSTENTDKTE
ncbi:MAG: hypothetical protein JNL75_11875 [Chitinophagales bacterium]|nr:hypothetical protein [Chitinophagales bacterium]